ncbi:hypothetical protein EZV77_24350 [Burkholderia thailandensis]|nr:hypothetical protein A8H32_10245 [Burkholderia thailandensis]PJO74139.1 hypothetical protein CWD92_02215 [Burkholderia thailandensis]TBW57313.1 hypothetical protein EZV77_24350 [Burkholderia thailandensis]TGB33828.1 hypothetical protein C6946_10275 [Burkholderia thailandensis]
MHAERFSRTRHLLRHFIDASDSESGHARPPSRNDDRAPPAASHASVAKRTLGNEAADAACRLL